MATVLTVDQVNALRLRAQGLHPAGRAASGDPAAIVRRLVGVQAQEADSAALALGVRSDTLTAREIEDARVRDRTFVRTWAFRGTLHLVAAADLGGLLGLLGPTFVRKSRRRFGELGLTDDRYASALAVIRDSLGNEGPMTRSALADQLDARAVPVEGQAVYHAIRRAGLEGILCYGPDRDGEPTFVLLRDWLPDTRVHDVPTPIVDLARRYLAGYGPAGPEDFAGWSGLGLRDSRAAFEDLADELLPVEVAGEPALMLKTHRPWLDEASVGSVVRLIPAYDAYLLGYRTRDLIVSDEDAHHIHPGGGFLRPTVIADGRAVGTWHLQHQGEWLTVTVTPFAALSDEVHDAVAGEVEALGSFYDADATLTLL